MKLLDYIKGNRKGKDAYRIERQAMDDPFLADALEGFDLLEGDHSKMIESLQKQVSRKLNPRTFHIKTWSIAATVLLCVSLGGYFIYNNLHLFEKSELVSVVQKEEIKLPERESFSLEESVDSMQDTIPVEEPVKLIKKEKENLKDVTIQLEKLPVSVEALSVAAIDIKRPETFSDDNYEITSPSMNMRGVGSSSQTIKGKIVDQNGEPLVGVSITQKGTLRGAVTNVDGSFSLNTNSNNSLEAKYLGFDSKEIQFDSSKSMLIAMNESKQALDEVVVIGYGSQKKSTVTGSVSAIKDQKPSPLAGMKVYQKYIKDNMNRPGGECSGKKGTVVLEFSVDSNGNPINIVIKKSVCAGHDIEALRLLQQGPKWIPGTETTELKVKF